MLPFATEFPVKPQENRAAFVAEVIAWLRGTTYSTVLAAVSGQDLDNENAHLRAASGEELRLRELRAGDDWTAIGFRHDFPDREGRLWRTEGVLRRGAAPDGYDLLRLRTQCSAQTPGARLESPRKPYLVKRLLNNGWGGNDSRFGVSDQAFWLTNSADGLVTATEVTLGSATRWLPTIYVSAIGDGAWLLSRDQIEKLAYDLGGIAHVVVEPDRSFSFDLRDRTAGRNAYGGTLGLSVPGRGIVRRFFLRWQLQDARQLSAAVKDAASAVRSQMPAVGWDWTELQEQALRAQRERDKKRLSAAENEQLYEEEIENLRDRVRELEIQITATNSPPNIDDEYEFFNENMAKQVGPEIYSGELSDRLRFAVRCTLDSADRIGLDARSKIIFQRIIDRTQVSPALGELRRDLERATRDPNRVARELSSLLARHGYFEKSQNRHIRLEAKNGFDGLDLITVPKTPSEIRGLNNLRKQIERVLGITKLGD